MRGDGPSDQNAVRITVRAPQKHASFMRAVQASVKVRATQDNVAGVHLPKFEPVKAGTDTKLSLIGLGHGGKQIQECR